MVSRTVECNPFCNVGRDVGRDVGHDVSSSSMAGSDSWLEGHQALIHLPGTSLLASRAHVLTRCSHLQHRTVSSDYVVIISGSPTYISPEEAFNVVDGKGTYGNVRETVCKAGDVVSQRGSAHS